MGDGLVGSDFAWRQQLKPIANAGTSRDVYLAIDQRRALRDCAREDVATLIAVASALPLRSGAIARLTVGDFDSRLGTLRIGKDKHGAGRRITLPVATASLISDLCKDKLPSARIVTQRNGRPWGKDAWKDHVKDAAVNAGLPAETVLTSLRHSVVTDLMHAGVDPLTVAQLAGTSIRMIQQHYGHLTQEHARLALEKLVVA